MKARFLTELQVKLVDEQRNRWRVLLPLVFHSALYESFFSVPAGFITDFASVPRVPLVYLLAGDTARSAAVVHDYLYTGLVDRDVADDVFLEAMAVSGVPAWRRYPMYWAVRACGGSRYKQRGNGRRTGVLSPPPGN